MRWLVPALALLSLGAVRAEETSLAVMDDRPLTAMGQHTPALSMSSGLMAYLRYVVGPRGDLIQALCVDSLQAAGMEKRLTSTSLVYHPSWRMKAARIVCVAVPDATERPVGIYEIDASGESDPLLLVRASKTNLPFAPTVGPDDKLLAYLAYSTVPARKGEIALVLFDLAKGQSVGEAPAWDEESFRISECSAPWWVAAGVVRVVGERSTPEGLMRAAYEYNAVKNQWRRVFEFAAGSSPESVAYSLASKRLAWLDGSEATVDLVLADRDGGQPTVLTTIPRPSRFLPRPFPSDVAWTSDGAGIVVTSGGNLRLLTLGTPEEAEHRVCRGHLTRLYRAFQRYAYDHMGMYPTIPEPPPGAAVEFDPWLWVTALKGTYVDDASLFSCAYDPDVGRERPASFVMNPNLYGKLFDQEALKREMPLLWEAQPWHEGRALVLYTDGRIALIEGAPSIPDARGVVPDRPHVQ